MENTLKIFDQQFLYEYADGYNFCSHERETFSELRLAIKSGDVAKLEWFAMFGTDIRKKNSYFQFAKLVSKEILAFFLL